MAGSPVSGGSGVLLLFVAAGRVSDDCCVTRGSSLESLEQDVTLKNIIKIMMIRVMSFACSVIFGNVDRKLHVGIC